MLQQGCYFLAEMIWRFKFVPKNLAISKNVDFMPLEKLVYILMLFEVLTNKFNISSIDLSSSLSTTKAISKL